MCKRSITLSLILLLCASPVAADPVADVVAAAGAAFDRMPALVRVDAIAGRCGADDSVNSSVAYCTSANTVFLAEAAIDAPQTAYLVAHAFGHAVQVQHGIADLALAQIRSRPFDEPLLRGLVERQVDCIAGFLMARAGQMPTRLTDWLSDDPLAGPHWGRDPLRVGPSLRLDLAARDEWVQRGQGGDLAACAPEGFGSDLLLKALK